MRESDSDVFEKKSREEFTCQLIVVDEASMINRQLYDDLLELEIPVIFCGDYESAVAMAEAGLGFMIFPTIGDAYKGPLKAIPIKGVKEISFGVYYLRSQLEKQAKDMLRILKKQFRPA